MFFFFSPLDFLTMAPKKSTHLKNLISHHGSSSSSSLPSLPVRDRFRDSKSQKDFDENFSDRVIHLECHAILSDFLDTPLLGAFGSRGWKSL